MASTVVSKKRALEEVDANVPPSARPRLSNIQGVADDQENAVPFNLQPHGKGLGPRHTNGMTDPKSVVEASPARYHPSVPALVPAISQSQSPGQLQLQSYPRKQVHLNQTVGQRTMRHDYQNIPPPADAYRTQVHPSQAYPPHPYAQYYGNYAVPANYQQKYLPQQYSHPVQQYSYPAQQSPPNRYSHPMAQGYSALPHGSPPQYHVQQQGAPLRIHQHFIPSNAEHSATQNVSHYAPGVQRPSSSSAWLRMAASQSNAIEPPGPVNIPHASDHHPYTHSSSASTTQGPTASPANYTARSRHDTASTVSTQPTYMMRPDAQAQATPSQSAACQLQVHDRDRCPPGRLGSTAVPSSSLAPPATGPNREMTHLQRQSPAQNWFGYPASRTDNPTVATQTPELQSQGAQRVHQSPWFGRIPGPPVEDSSSVVTAPSVASQHRPQLRTVDYPAQPAEDSPNLPKSPNLALLAEVRQTWQDSSPMVFVVEVLDDEGRTTEILSISHNLEATLQSVVEYVIDNEFFPDDGETQSALLYRSLGVHEERLAHFIGLGSFREDCLSIENENENQHELNPTAGNEASIQVKRQELGQRRKKLKMPLIDLSIELAPPAAGE